MWVVVFGWFGRGGSARQDDGETKREAARLRALESELARLDEQAAREEAQFQRQVAQPPRHLQKYEVIRWREERRRERDGRLAGLRDRQEEIRQEVGALRRRIDRHHSAAAD